MIIREPIVAGQFYPEKESRCKRDLSTMLENVSVELPKHEHVIAGLVPHAGWTYSGAVTAQVMKSLGESHQPDVVILFGGVHRFHGKKSAMFCSGVWETPLGRANIDDRLAERILGHTNLLTDDHFAHENEHSIEVQLPFIQSVFPETKILPIMVPPSPRAHEVGEAVARTLKVYQYKAMVIGTTDLTHYGPHYGFVPQGVGQNGNTWAMEVNDRRFIDLTCNLRSRDLVEEALKHKNACSSGAVAATVAAAIDLGANGSSLLTQTSSSVVAMAMGETDVQDSVGYAGIVFMK